MKNFSELLEEFRLSRRINKKDLANFAGLTPSYVSQLTLGEKNSPSEEVVLALARALKLDWQAKRDLLEAAGYSPTSENEIKDSATSSFVRQEDLSEAPSATAFYGRGEELERLEQWIGHEHCQVVLILGIGGVGKTSLAAAIASQLKNEFDYILWRSLHNAPPLATILKTCIQFVSGQDKNKLPEDMEEQMTLLIGYLQRHRCLLVLDNMESILQEGQRAGQYSSKYEGYGQLIQRLGEVQHRSCLILTSREKPHDIAYMEGEASPVRTMELMGLNITEGRDILHDKSLSGRKESWEHLINLYSGNPLALKLVSESIRNVYAGNIDDFLRDLKEDELALGDIDKLVEQQFRRLADSEQEVLYWLAIEREVVSLENLHGNLLNPVSMGAFMEIIASLRRRSMIEMRGSGLFTLQPVVMEYVTSDLIKRASEEFNWQFSAQSRGVWMRFSFMKALSEDYIRDSQRRLILKQIENHLLNSYEKQMIEAQSKSMLTDLRKVSPQLRGYMGGNILNLLIDLGWGVQGYDFSHIVVRQAYLQNAFLSNVNFEHANFIASAFTNTFGDILSTTFSPDGLQLAAGTATGSLCIYNVSDGKLLFTCEGHTDSVWCINFNPNGQIFASSSDDGTICIWRASDGQLLQVLRGHKGRVRSIAFSPDGRILASGSDDKTVGLWDVDSWTRLDLLEGHEDRVWCVVFSLDGTKLATGGTDNTIRLWDVNNRLCFRVLSDHTNWIRSLAFSPNGHILASGSDDKTIKLWDISIDTPRMTLTGHSNHVWSVAFNSDGSQLASGCEDHTIRLWDAKTGQCLDVMDHHAKGVRSVAFNPDGTLLASGGDDQTVRLWKVEKVSCSCLRTLQGYTNRMWSVSLSSDGKLVSCSEDQLLRIWDIKSGHVLKVFHNSSHSPRDVTFNTTGTLVASAGEDQDVFLWEADTGRNLKRLQGHTGWLRCVAFSHNGSLLASCGEDHTIRVWSAETGRCLKLLQEHTSWVRSVAFSPDDLFLASAGDDQMIYLWNVETGNHVQKLQGHSRRVRSVAFRQDGKLLASGGEDGVINLWQVKDGTHKASLTDETKPTWVLAVAFHPTGEFLASGYDDGIIRIWNTATGLCVYRFLAHEQRIRKLSFVPGSDVLVSCSDDGTIKIWDLSKKALVKVMRGARPYEGMRIANARGINAAQKEMLLLLGAVDA